LKQVYLHVGMPKTGTTAIQKAMSGARAELRANGVLYPGEMVDHALLVPEFHRFGPGHFHFRNRGIAAHDAKLQSGYFWARICEEIEEFEGSVLLSSEYLYNMGASGLGRLDRALRQLGFDLTVVCYVRHPVSLAISSAQQNIKRGTSTLAEMIEHPRWHSVIEALEPPLRVLGRERMIVRSHAETLEQGAERDILRAIGYRGQLKAIPRRLANPALSREAVLLIDAYHAMVREKSLPANALAGLLKVEGDRFSLPRQAVDRILRESALEMEWLEQQFGISLAAPDVLPRDPDMPSPTELRERVLACLGRARQEGRNDVRPS
jgi:hypothetical protein